MVRLSFFVLVLFCGVVVSEFYRWKPGSSSVIGYRAPCDGEPINLGRPLNKFFQIQTRTFCGEKYGKYWLKMSQIEKYNPLSPEYLNKNPVLWKESRLQQNLFGKYEFGDCSNIFVAGTYKTDYYTTHRLYRYFDEASTVMNEMTVLQKIVYVSVMSAVSERFQVREERISYDPDDRDECNPDHEDKNRFKGRGYIKLRGKCMYEETMFNPILVQYNLIEDPQFAASHIPSFDVSSWLLSANRVYKNFISEEYFRYTGYTEWVGTRFRKITAEFTDDDDLVDLSSFIFNHCLLRVLQPIFSQGNGCVNPFGCSNSTGPG